MDKETLAAIENINSGSLAQKIKQNTKYTATGVAIGAVAGFLIASLAGKGQLLFSGIGALAGGSIGYLTSPKKRKEV